MDDHTETDQPKETIGLGAEHESPVQVSEPRQPVVSQGGGKKRGLKLFIILLVVAAAAATGWGLYQKHQDNSKAAKAASSNKDIPLLKLSIFNPGYGDLYPNVSANDYGTSVNMQMFEGLVRYEGKTRIAPDLASNWTNPDSKTWIFTVKQGIKFHDGHTLTAKDVKYSLDTVIASKSDFAQTFTSTIASADVINNNQVKITTTDPDPTLLNKLTFLYIIDANLPKGDEPSQAGTGPYEIKPGTKPTNKNVQMVAFDNYHFGRPTTRALDFGAENTNAELIKALQTHKANIVGYVNIDANAKGATKFITSEPDVNYLGFNIVRSSPVQNKLVREAIRYAVDPVAIGKASGNGGVLISQMIPPSIPGYNPAIPPYKQDIAKAKQLLAQAGYPNGLTIRFSTSAGPESTDEIVSELKNIGITLTVDQHNNFDEYISYFSNGDADMYVIDYTSDTLDGVDIFNTTLPSTNYNNPKVADLLDQANATVDPAKRLKLLQEVGTIVDQDIPVVPLTGESDLWLMDKSYVIHQDTPTTYMPVYFYKVHLK